MPWKETCPMEERFEFIREWLKKEWTISKLCEMYSISRKTGYKWLERFESGGMRNLAERSRARHHHQNATSKEVEEKIIAFRQKHKHWGPRKLIDRLEIQEPDIVWPSLSTVGSLLKRRGVVIPRRLRRRIPLFTGIRHQVEEPNDVWATDFKGWFMTQNGKRVDPLTITDLASRFLIRCEAVKKTNGIEVRAQFEKTFREHGMPWSIRSDNGPPFAGIGLGGLSRLSVWWIRLGIMPERIRPGHPEENGSHERMHRTLKQETAQPPKENYGCQQKAFNAFRQEFNEDRPHESLNMKTPGECYRPSVRRFPARLPEVEYSSDYRVRRVRSNGTMRWNGGLVFLSESLIGEPVGFKKIDDKTWSIYFGPLLLATFDDETKRWSRTNQLKK